MARPSKLTAAQCEKARTLRAEGVTIPKLAKKFKVSESSMYKVMDGTYTARKEAAAPVAEVFVPKTPCTPVTGVTPSVFNGPRIRRITSNLHPTMAKLMRRQAEASIDEEIDEVTLAAAELIIAKAYYARALSHIN